MMVARQQRTEERVGSDRKGAPNGAGFDFAIFRRALETQDLEAWLDCFADHAQWIEFRHDAPSGAPTRIVGKSEIAAFLRRVKASNVRLTIRYEIVASDGCAFSVLREMPDGRRLLEHSIVHIADGKIVRQVDLDAWD